MGGGGGVSTCKEENEQTEVGHDQEKNDYSSWLKGKVVMERI